MPTFVRLLTLAVTVCSAAAALAAPADAARLQGVPQAHGAIGWAPVASGVEGLWRIPDYGQPTRVTRVAIRDASALPTTQSLSVSGRAAYFSRCDVVGQHCRVFRAALHGGRERPVDLSPATWSNRQIAVDGSWTAIGRTSPDGGQLAMFDHGQPVATFDGTALGIGGADSAPGRVLISGAVAWFEWLSPGADPRCTPGNSPGGSTISIVRFDARTQTAVVVARHTCGNTLQLYGLDRGRPLVGTDLPLTQNPLGPGNCLLVLTRTGAVARAAAMPSIVTIGGDDIAHPGPDGDAALALNAAGTTLRLRQWFQTRIDPVLLRPLLLKRDRTESLTSLRSASATVQRCAAQLTPPMPIGTAGEG